MAGGTAVIAVTSLSLEARIALGPGVSVICEHASRLVAALEAAIAQGVAGIISFGVAGGLAPDLAAGAWVIGIRSAHRTRMASRGSVLGAAPDRSSPGGPAWRNCGG